MINYSPILVKKLKEINGLRVVPHYPTIEAKLPVVGYMEESNIPFAITNEGEELTKLMYKLDFFSESSEGDFINKINEAMTSLGFKRIFFTDAPEKGNLIHKVFRYEIIVDKNLKQSYHS